MGPQICGFPAVGCRKEHPDRGCPLASDESSGDAPGGLKDAALGTRESGARTTRVSEKTPPGAAQPRVEPLVPLGALLQSILVTQRGEAKVPIPSKGTRG